jgi:hypothetical protein
VKATLPSTSKLSMSHEYQQHPCLSCSTQVCCTDNSIVNLCLMVFGVNKYMHFSLLLRSDGRISSHHIHVALIGGQKQHDFQPQLSMAANL